MKIQIYLKGLEQLEKNIDEMLKEATSGKTKILLEEARVVRDAIKANVPVGPTGNLRKAVYASVLPETSKTRVVAFAGIRPWRAPHAHLVEFGHGGPYPAPPHPFVRPTWDAIKDKVRADIARKLKVLIEGAV